MEQQLKFWKEWKIILNLMLNDQILPENLVKWQKFDYGTLTRHDNIPFDHWWQDANTDTNIGSSWGWQLHEGVKNIVDQVT